MCYFSQYFVRNERVKIPVELRKEGIRKRSKSLTRLYGIELFLDVLTFWQHAGDFNFNASLMLFATSYPTNGSAEY